MGFFLPFLPPLQGKNPTPYWWKYSKWEALLPQFSRRCFTHELSQNCLDRRFTQIPGFSSVLALWKGLGDILPCMSFIRIEMHLKYKTLSLQSIFSTIDKSQTCRDGLALSRVRFTLQLKYYCSSPVDFLGFKLNSDAGRFGIGGWWFILPPL